MFYHRPQKNIDLPPALKEEIFKDMMQYGFLLPHWVPLLTRYMCRRAGADGGPTMAAIHKYHPYDSNCFGKGGDHPHSFDIVVTKENI